MGKSKAMALKHKHMRAFFMTNALLLSTAYLQHISYLSPSLCGPLDFFLPIKLKNSNKIQFWGKLRTKKNLFTNMKILYCCHTSIKAVSCIAL